MATNLSNSEVCCSVSNTDRSQAWNIYAVLLNLGRPCSPHELAAKCQVSPDFVKFLCSIPDSPLLLTDDLYVTISLATLSSAGEFALDSILKFMPGFTVRVSGSKRLLDGVETYFGNEKRQRIDQFLLNSEKQRILSFPEENDDQTRFILADHSLTLSSTKAHVDLRDKHARNMDFLRGGLPITAFNSGISTEESTVHPLLLGQNTDIPSCGTMAKEDDEKDGAESNIIVHRELLQSVYAPKGQQSFGKNNDIDLNFPTVALEEAQLHDPSLDLRLSTTKNIVASKEVHLNLMDFSENTGQAAINCLEAGAQCDDSPLEFSHDHEAPGSRILELVVENSSEEEQIQIKSGPSRTGGRVNTFPTDNTAKTLELLKNDSGMLSVNYHDIETSGQREKTTAKMEFYDLCSSSETSTTKMQPRGSSAKAKRQQRDTCTTQGIGSPSLSLNCIVDLDTPKQQEPCKTDQKSMSMKEKLKQNHNHAPRTKEKQAEANSITQKIQLESKALPNFESFILEEEEGSGGYGTVYRARRKSDGKTFAIKCPHENAHMHHVTNEMKMLQRFGGRNFVIKYEGSFKFKNSECFILEHVEHDRPEVLKRDIDVSKLQWYGYCMFRALASLHRQGIVHRDVKPGNFLFSRKLSKGYLIDFNLAMDLHHKFGTTSKSKMGSSQSFNQVPLPSAKTDLPVKDRKVAASRSPAAQNQEIAKDSKPSLESKTMKKRADMGNLKAHLDRGNRRHKLNTQAAEGSGITSTRDATSTRTPSGERQREPLPSRGRKELLSLVQEARRSPNQKEISFPSSQRKRIAASPSTVDNQLLYLTPMPLHSTGSAVAGAGLPSNKGDRKQKREGPCVGTKGFRAPEVLFKSPHQGPKVDVWSAGVTLLYLMIGRSPFIGDPEQNIKDIAKLRGSEDLWEVAKLHNRESSFPMELLDIKSLPSTELRKWCKANTKRPEFIDMIPTSLFDLVDKCLTVNPRLRISAEEALNHEFFAYCHEILRKQRLLRRRLSQDSESANPSQD